MKASHKILPLFSVSMHQRCIHLAWGTVVGDRDPQTWPAMPSSEELGRSLWCSSRHAGHGYGPVPQHWGFGTRRSLSCQYCCGGFASQMQPWGLLTADTSVTSAGTTNRFFMLQIFCFCFQFYVNLFYGPRRSLVFWMAQIYRKVMFSFVMQRLCTLLYGFWKAFKNVSTHLSWVMLCFLFFTSLYTLC